METPREDLSNHFSRPMVQSKAGLEGTTRRDMNHKKSRNAKTKRKAAEYKVFQPSSGTFVKESKTDAFLWPTINVSLEAQQDNLQEPSRFPQFTFLNACGSRIYPAASRSAARAHVMRHVLKKREARNTKVSLEPEDHVSFPQQATQKPIVSPLLTVLSPFSTTTRQYEIPVINHFIQVLLKSLLPVSSLDESWWFDKALNDDACYHATLFLSAAHSALISESYHDLPQNSYWHKGEAIRIINRRLFDPNQRIEDGTLAAIACLAAYENINGQLDIAGSHIKGLQILRSLRGGFHGCGMNGLLMKFICWVDLCNASASRLQAQFVSENILSLAEPVRAFSDSDGSCQTWASQWDIPSYKIVTLRSYDGLSVSKATIFHRIQQISYIRATVQSIRQLDADLLQSFTAEVLAIERQINAIVHCSGANKFGANVEVTCVPFFSSVLLYLYLALRELPPRSSILDNFLRRLRSAWEQLISDGLWREVPPGLLLWILFIGGWAAQGRSDRSWFTSNIAWLTKKMELKKWTDTKNLLTEYIFIESFCERPCKALWNELGSVD